LGSVLFEIVQAKIFEVAGFRRDEGEKVNRLQARADKSTSMKQGLIYTIRQRAFGTRLSIGSLLGLCTVRRTLS
jgi:hypothetical protein